MASTTLFSIQHEKSLSTEFKKFFLLEFTKQLILNSAPLEILKIKGDIKRRLKSPESPVSKEDIKERVHEILNPAEEGYEKSDMPKTEEIPEMSNIEKTWTKPKIKRRVLPFDNSRYAKLIIPESNLPERLRYLKPTPTSQEIDLGKLNPFIKDPFVRTIECSGPDLNVSVTGTMGDKKTAIKLTNEEINDVIQSFSGVSKIPVQEGVFKVAVGRLIFMAIISDVVGSKFIINKMISSNMPLIPPMHR